MSESNTPQPEEGPADEPDLEPASRSDPPRLFSEIVDLYSETNPAIRSVQTVRRYHTMVANFSRFLGRDATAEDLTVDNYGRFCHARKGQVADGTIRGEAEKLLVIWRWWLERNGLPVPKVALPSPVRHNPVAWTPDELMKLEKAAATCEWNVGRVPGRLFWPALIGVAADTGERIRAIHQLQPMHFDLRKRTVFIPARLRKGASRDMYRGLLRQTAKQVEKLFEIRPVNPFAPIKLTSLYGPMRRLTLEAGLEYSRTRSFHCLRRFHATQVHLQGGDATDALGHSDPRLARESYLDPTQLPVDIPNRLTLERPGLLNRLRRLFGKKYPRPRPPHAERPGLLLARVREPLPRKEGKRWRV